MDQAGARESDCSICLPAKRPSTCQCPVSSSVRDRQSECVRGCNGQSERQERCCSGGSSSDCIAPNFRLQRAMEIIFMQPQQRAAHAGCEEKCVVDRCFLGGAEYIVIKVFMRVVCLTKDSTLRVSHGRSCCCGNTALPYVVSAMM